MAEISFTVDIHEDPDGSYWAQVEELPGCYASGFSMEELQEAVAEAIQLYLPDGIVLDDPVWSEPKAPSRSKAGQNKPALRRKMLVTA